MSDRIRRDSLHLGCGMDYKKGFVNCDGNPLVKSDCCFNFEKPWPFPDNRFIYVFTSHTIEHIHQEAYFTFIDELWRVCKPGAIIEIYVPHYRSVWALKIPSHHMYFGVGSFVCFTEESSDRQTYAKARFKVVDEKLITALRGHPIPYRWLNIFNPVLNVGGRQWQQLMERFWPLGMDEVYFKLEVIK